MSRSERRNRIRSLAATSGRSSRGAANILKRDADLSKRAAADPVACLERGQGTDPIDVLIAEFRAFHVSCILVGRISPQGSGPSHAEALHRATELADHPKYFGRSASYSRELTREELQALLARGATDDNGGVQRIDVFRTGRNTTFSVPCAYCDRWIHCGDEERTDTCECGSSYEVTFDGKQDLSLPRGWYCMLCATPFELALAGDARNPWQVIKRHQVMCGACFRMRHVAPWWVQKRAAEQRERQRA